MTEIEQFFWHQYGLVMFRFQFMREYFPEETPAEPVRVMEAKKAIDPAALKRWNEIWRDVELQTTSALQATVKAVQSDALVKGGEQLRNQIGFDPKRAFSLANPRAVEWMRKNGGSVQYIKDIQDTTKESLQKVITTALDTGQSYNTTGQQIRDLFDGPITTKRAQLIAVTESARAYEAGNMAFAQSVKDDGVEMEKMWTTSHDDRVSDGCEENESDGWIPIDQYHRSGDQEPPRFPGCRCYEVYREARA